MSISADGFAIWITGLPASGKTALAKELLRTLSENYNIRMIHLESDELRRILTPEPIYSPDEREWFYGVLQYFAGLLSSNGVCVLIDATANRRYYREEARRRIRKFLEVYVKCPLEICVSRDPKGIYATAKAGQAATVPGLQEKYEEPENPDVVVESDKVDPVQGANLVIRKLQSLRWI